MATKERLDKVLVQRGFCESRQRAQALIMTGGVLVNDTPIDKSGTRIPLDAEIRLKKQPLRYVSRGGLKLEAALKAFSFDPTACTAMDLGASTGGFTDCLLQHGCKRVLAIDVGYGQLHSRLRNDPRVHNMERTNARHLTLDMLPLEEDERIDLITADLSFISLRLILETISSFLEEGGAAIVLIKPQFEAGREHIQKGGVVRDDSIRTQCADNVAQIARELGLQEQERIDCPVHGPKGNIEILMHFQKTFTSTSPESHHEED